MKDAYSAYKTANVDTADQGKLILIAYDVAIKHCRSALEKFNNRSLIDERIRHLYKVQDAITELISALRLDVGEIAKNLYKLYDYMLWRIINANVKNNKEHVEEVLKHLVSLREAWAEAIVMVRAENRGQEGVTDTKSIAVTG
jgi:flagellar protein FliS